MKVCNVDCGVTRFTIDQDNQRFDTGIPVTPSVSLTANLRHLKSSTVKILDKAMIEEVKAVRCESTGFRKHASMSWPTKGSHSRRAGAQH